MTSLQQLQKEKKMIERALGLRHGRKDILIMRMWLPDSDPKHDMTDEEIIQQAVEADERHPCGNKIVAVIPLCDRNGENRVLKRLACFVNDAIQDLMEVEKNGHIRRIE